MNESRLLQAIVDHIPEGVVVTDGTGAFRFFNRAAERILGIGLTDSPPEQWSSVYGVYLPDQKTPFPTDQYPLLLALRGVETNDVEQFIRNAKIPEGILIGVTGRPLRDDTGAIAGAIVVFRDITERRRLEMAEDELRRAREKRSSLLEEELQKVRTQLLRVEALATLGNLASAVGHELSNIGTVAHAVTAMLEMAARQNQAPEPEDIEELRRVAEHITVHARQLLALGRPPVERYERMDLRDVVTGTISMLRTAGRIKHIDVHSDLPSGPVHAVVNRTRIEQVLVNLVVNAADALEAARGPKRLRIGLRQDLARGRVQIEVEDNGPGIAREQIDVIFEPYYTTKPPGRGTGLGLAVVKQIVEAHDGKIDVESAPGRGARFTVDIPASAVPATESRPAPRTLPPVKRFG